MKPKAAVLDAQLRTDLQLTTKEETSEALSVLSLLSQVSQAKAIQAPAPQKVVRLSEH